MKKYIILCGILIFTISSQAQQDVYLRINHALGNNHFSYNQSASNDLGNSFQVTRLEYYIAQITLTYDGGQDTTVSDLWILVDASDTTNVLLGNYSFSNLESVRFGIGVESSVNHLDPSSYPTNHPLAHKAPSMHWGWSAGYRFVAMEGLTGSNMSDVFQVHALGDNNYHTQTISTSGTVQGSDLIINLDADYEQALSSITVSAGLINHGSNGQSITLLNNFRDHVFKEASGNIGIQETEIEKVEIYPNPLRKGESLNIAGVSSENTAVRILDLSGKVIFDGKGKDACTAVKDLSVGSYLISVVDVQGAISNHKLLITQ